MDVCSVLNGVDISRDFMAGAASVACRSLPDDQALEFVSTLCKEASDLRNWKYAAADDEEEEGKGSTFLGRNKWWIIPAIAGGLSFWAGASGERNGRKDRNYIQNAWSNIKNRIGILLGSDPGPATAQTTSTRYVSDYDDKEMSPFTNPWTGLVDQPVAHPGLKHVEYGDKGIPSSDWRNAYNVGRLKTYQD